MSQEEKKNGPELSEFTGTTEKSRQSNISSAGNSDSRAGGSGAGQLIEAASEIGEKRRKNRKAKPPHNPESNSHTQRTVSAESVATLRQNPDDLKPKPKRKSRVRELEGQLAETQAKLVHYESAINQQQTAEAVVTALVEQAGMLTDTILPPPFEVKEKRVMIQAWTPVLQTSDIQISPLAVALLATTGIFLPRILVAVKNWNEKRQKEKHIPPEYQEANV